MPEDKIGLAVSMFVSAYKGHEPLVSLDSTVRLLNQRGYTEEEREEVSKKVLELVPNAQEIVNEAYARREKERKTCPTCGSIGRSKIQKQSGSPPETISSKREDWP